MTITVWLRAACLLAVVAAPAFAQVPVLTNADLGKPHARVVAVTPVVWMGIVARQFIYVGPDTDTGGARVVLIPDTTPHPDLPPTYPLDPSFMQTYVGPGWYPRLGSWYPSHDDRSAQRNQGRGDATPPSPVPPPDVAGGRRGRGVAIGAATTGAVRR